MGLFEDLSKADFITALNLDLENKIRSFLPKQKIMIVPNWVEEHFKPKKIEKPREKIILFVGRLCEQKGADVLIKAIQYIKLDFKAVFIGPPWKQKEFEKLTNELQVAEKVEFKGFVDESELVEWYNQSSVLVYPTIERGGFGFTVIEAMACGIPVVGSDDMGVPYAVGNAGIITKRGDEKDLAAGISKLLTDEDLYGELCKNAIKRVNENFRRDIVLKNYLELYEKLLA
jgi:glycosyltransferase involved in cell wall biosynthesis